MSHMHGTNLFNLLHIVPRQFLEILKVIIVFTISNSIGRSLFIKEAISCNRLYQEVNQIIYSLFTENKAFVLLSKVMAEVVYNNLMSMNI